MIFRRVNKADIPQIQELYKKQFNIFVSKEIYNYFYYNRTSNEYYSVVAEDKNRIVGHNSVILNKYLFKEKEIVIGLSSGSMVLREYCGLFYDILKYIFHIFQGDIIIGFPNKNSQGFFTKIFNFETIYQNYFTIDNSKTEYLKTLKDIECKSNFSRTKEYINWRINKHPINIYKKISLGRASIIYKENNLSEINVIFVNYFNDEFIKILIRLLKNYKKINIIHWDRNYIEKIGFEEQKYHIFVYKNISNKIKISAFECQMIDSDAF